MNRGKRGMILACLTSAVLLTAVSLASAENAASTGPELITPPAGQPTEGKPSATYDSLDAGRDAYQRAEAERRGAIQRQIESNRQVPGTADPLGYYPLRGIGPVYAVPLLRPARRAVWAYRNWESQYPYSVYRPPLLPLTPLPVDPRGALPGYLGTYPSGDRVQQPLGHVVTPTGPNGYIYRPYYGSERGNQGAAPPANPPPPQPPEVNPPTDRSNLNPVPEPIPTPPAQGNPREF